MTEDWQLIVFVKVPQPGRVKTRLATTVGFEQAADAYREIVERLLHALRKVVNVQLRVAPGGERATIEHWCRPNWKMAPQCGGNLGAKLSEAVQESFRKGFGKTVVIGSDCPYVAESDIIEAIRLLEDCDIVLGPATDGGYWLIGMNEPHADVFTNIQWSTPSVLSETQDRANTLGLSCQLLRTLSDIDTIDDLKAYERFRSDTPD